MAEPANGRFWNRPNHELHETGVGRRLWQHVRATHRVIEREEPHQQAPYEAAYDVARGYSAERPIDVR